MSCQYCKSENCKGQRCPDCTSWQGTHGHSDPVLGPTAYRQKEGFITVEGPTHYTIEFTGFWGKLFALSPFILMFGYCVFAGSCK